MTSLVYNVISVICKGFKDFCRRLQRLEAGVNFRDQIQSFTGGVDPLNRFLVSHKSQDTFINGEARKVFYGFLDPLFNFLGTVLSGSIFLAEFLGAQSLSLPFV